MESEKIKIDKREFDMIIEAKANDRAREIIAEQERNKEEEAMSDSDFLTYAADRLHNIGIRDSMSQELLIAGLCVENYLLKRANEAQGNILLMQMFKKKAESDRFNNEVNKTIEADNK